MCLMAMRITGMVSKHYSKERCKREKFIEERLGGDGLIIDGFVIDNHHPNGLEVHSITENGIILIHNMESGKLISKLIARPSQIKRYYKSTGREPPVEYERILKLAEWHKNLDYNR